MKTVKVVSANYNFKLEEELKGKLDSAFNKAGIHHVIISARGGYTKPYLHCSFKNNPKIAFELWVTNKEVQYYKEGPTGALHLKLKSFDQDELNKAAKQFSVWIKQQ